MRFSVGCSLLLAAACGGSPTGGGNQTPQAAVSMTDNQGAAPYKFSPAALTIKAGTVVTWTDNGTTAHTATSDAAQPIWDSGTVLPAGSTSCPPSDPYCQPGTTPAGKYQRMFDTPGTYAYHCQFHGSQGMTGTITVTP